MLVTTRPEGYAASCAAVRNMEQRAVISAIATPVLVIVNREDAATPPDHGEFIAATVCDGRLVALDAAHISNVEACEAFTGTVADFLA